MSSAAPPPQFSSPLDRLAVAAMNGDPQALAHLRLHMDPGVVRYFSARIPRDRDRCEELAHCVWVECWKSLKLRRFDPARASISTYVYSICRHAWMGELRLRGRPRPPAGPEPISPPADDLLAHAELLTALGDCVQSAGLSGEERAVILAIVEGRTERDLAKTLDLAASTVHQRKSDACAKLRGCLAKKGFSQQIVEQIQLQRELT